MEEEAKAYAYDIYTRLERGVQVRLDNRMQNEVEGEAERRQ